MNAPDLNERKESGAQYTSPAFRLAVFADASDLDLLFGVSSQCVQLTPGTFRAELATLRLGPVRILELTCNRGIHLRSDGRAGKLLLGCVTHADELWEHGRHWSRDEVLASWGAPISLSALSPIEVVWLQLDLGTLTDEEKAPLPKYLDGSSYIVDAGTGAFDDLRVYLRGVLREYLTRSVSSLNGDGYRRTESQLVDLAANALQSALPKHTDTKTTRQRYKLVERVVEYMWENVEEPLTLERICSEMHCRMRSLIYSFKNTVGIGPMTYLKILRLNAAREKLKMVGSAARIFDVAADFGFWHMGHFSSDYRRLFGTTASETIAAAESQDDRVVAAN
jgi:AraC family transcriptional regulator, ethanolamine operon transcriptional activator